MQKGTLAQRAIVAGSWEGDVGRGVVCVCVGGGGVLQAPCRGLLTRMVYLESLTFSLFLHEHVQQSVHFDVLTIILLSDH